MRRRTLILLCAILALPACTGSKKTSPTLVAPVNFSSVRIEDSFWSPRLDSHKDVTLQVCIDQI